MDRLYTWLETQKGAVSARDYALLAKAGTILQSNVCDGPQFPWYPYRCIRPFGGIPFDDPMVGIWNWDSAFHAVGVSRWDMALAKEQIIGFIQYQLDNGMFIDVMWGRGEVYDCSTKPPVMAWAAAELYKKDGDLRFVEQVYPKLAANEAFWRRERYHKGLFRYGADMDRVPFAEVDQYVRYESGWDDSVRWDNPCSDYWAIDLNCYMVMTYRGMAVLARALGDETEARVYETREKALTENINRYLWNEEIKTYTDTNRFTGEPSRIMTPASFMPLYIGVATEERAAYMARFAGDEKKLYPGMPTVSYDDPEYSQKYWRGNTWLNVAYFAAKGLKNYGFTDIAEGIRQTILSWVERDGDCIHENYNSTTGEGLFNAKFSWSSVFVMEFILNF